jgi:hypothetical protein
MRRRPSNAGGRSWNCMRGSLVSFSRGSRRQDQARARTRSPARALGRPRRGREHSGPSGVLRQRHAQAEETTQQREGARDCLGIPHLEGRREHRRSAHVGDPAPDQSAALVLGYHEGLPAMGMRSLRSKTDCTSPRNRSPSPRARSSYQAAAAANSSDAASMTSITSQAGPGASHCFDGAQGARGSVAESRNPSGDLFAPRLLGFWIRCWVSTDRNAE